MWNEEAKGEAIAGGGEMRGGRVKAGGWSASQVCEPPLWEWTREGRSVGVGKERGGWRAEKTICVSCYRKAGSQNELGKR